MRLSKHKSPKVCSPLSANLALQTQCELESRYQLFNQISSLKEDGSVLIHSAWNTIQHSVFIAQNLTFTLWHKHISVLCI